MKIKIRPATPKDIHGLLEVEEEANHEIKWWEKQSKKEFLHSMRVSKYNIIVAELNNKIIGYVQAELNIRGYGRFKNLFLENIYVLKKYRRKGIAKLLVKEFAKHWCTKGKNIELVTTRSNMAVFKKLGFKWTMVYMKR